MFVIMAALAMGGIAPPRGRPLATAGVLMFATTTLFTSSRCRWNSTPAVGRWPRWSRGA